MKPDALLAEFMRHLRVERGLSRNTWLSYGYQLKGYLAFLAARGKGPLSAGRGEVLALLEAKKDDGSRSASIFAAAVAVRQFHRFLADTARAAADPCQGMRLPRLNQRLPRPLGTADMERLLAAANGAKFHLVRTLAMLELMYATGMRVSELVGLKENALNLQEGSVLISGKGGRERVLPINPSSGEVLHRYLEAREKRLPGRTGPVFLTSRGKPMNRRAFWWDLRRLALRAGIAGSVHPHQIRHSAATQMLEGGADIRVIQADLGHRSIMTSQRYTHVSAELLRKSCEQAHPRFQRPA
jgi:integrase/recombinase XerD